MTHSDSFLRALTRLYKENDGIIFSNRDGTFELLLRCDPDDDPEDSEAMDFEVLIVYHDDKDASRNFKQLLEREAMTSISDDEEAEFIISEWSIQKSSTAESDDVLRAMRFLNWCYDLTICPCNNYLIKDAPTNIMCVFCQMTATPDTLQSGMCVICHEETPLVTMKQQGCCKQYIHPLCLDKWYCRTEFPQCPTCRAIK